MNDGLDLGSVLDALPDIVLLIDRAGTLVGVNEAAETLLGWSRSEWVGRSVLTLVHPDDLALVDSSMAALLGKRFGTPIEIRAQTAAGEWKWLEVVGATIPERTDALLCVARDITRRRVFEVGNRDLDRFQQVVQHAAAITLLLDRAGRVRSVSGAFTRLLGHDPTLVIGRHLVGFATPDGAVALQRALNDAIQRGHTARCEVPMSVRQGGTRPIRFEIVNLLDDPVVDGLVVTGHDVTDLFTARSELQRLALHDALTGLANRAMILERLGSVVAEGTPACVIFIDLDRFKPVNDLLGHASGDQLLIAVGERLREIVRPADIVARVGGDEFVVLAAGVADHATADRLADRIELGLGAPYELGHGPVRVTASVGVALSDANSTVTSLLADADAAMYAAKTAKRGAGTAPRLDATERRERAEELGDGIARGEVVAHLQPIVRSDDGGLIGFEALARWEHPRLGLLRPVQFLDIAEEAGLAVALGDAVLDSACESFARLAVGPDVRLSVNLSVGQLADRDLCDRIVATLLRHGLSPHDLTVELTESATLPGWTGGGFAAPESSLMALRALGATLALDDFGTGYSSLTYIRRFPISTVKIDRSFVEGILERAEDRAVVAAVVGLATTLGLTVVAEGVESPAQLDALRALGCSAVQGYLIAAAMPVDELSTWVNQLSATP